MLQAHKWENAMTVDRLVWDHNIFWRIVQKNWFCWVCSHDCENIYEATRSFRESWGHRRNMQLKDVLSMDELIETLVKTVRWWAPRLGSSVAVAIVRCTCSTFSSQLRRKPSDEHRPKQWREHRTNISRKAETGFNTWVPIEVIITIFLIYLTA